MKECSAIRKHSRGPGARSDSDCKGAEPIDLATYCVLSMARRIVSAIEVRTIGEPGWQKVLYEWLVDCGRVLTGGRTRSQ